MMSPETVTRSEPVSQQNPDLSQPGGSAVYCATTGDIGAKLGAEPVSQGSENFRAGRNWLRTGSLAQTGQNGRKTPAGTQYTGEPLVAIFAGSRWLSWLSLSEGPKWT